MDLHCCPECREVDQPLYLYVYQVLDANCSWKGSKCWETHLSSTELDFWTDHRCGSLAANISGSWSTKCLSPKRESLGILQRLLQINICTTVSTTNKHLLNELTVTFSFKELLPT